MNKDVMEKCNHCSGDISAKAEICPLCLQQMEKHLKNDTTSASTNMAKTALGVVGAIAVTLLAPSQAINNWRCCDRF